MKSNLLVLKDFIDKKTTEIDCLNACIAGAVFLTEKQFLDRYKKDGIYEEVVKKTKEFWKKQIEEIENEALNLENIKGIVG